MCAQRRWAWHQLSPPWAHRLVADAHLVPGELIVDLGAGTGALAIPAARAGADVIAVELHAGRAAALRRRATIDRAPRVPGSTTGTLRVVEADLLSVALPSRRPYRVLANPPFNHTAALLRRLTDRRTRATELRLLLQRAVVRDLADQPPRGWRLVDVRNLPRSAFRPRPTVDTAMVVLRRR